MILLCIGFLVVWPFNLSDWSLTLCLKSGVLIYGGNWCGFSDDLGSFVASGLDISCFLNGINLWSGCYIDEGSIDGMINLILVWLIGIDSCSGCGVPVFCNVASNLSSEINKEILPDRLH